MNRAIKMKYYNSLRQTNPKLAKTRKGRSLLMNEAVESLKIKGQGASIIDLFHEIITKPIVELKLIDHLES